MPPALPALLRVLCATDLSEFGNRAVPFAFAAVAPGGCVTLLHVLHTRPVPSPLVPHYDAEKRASEQELAAQERHGAAHLAALARPLAEARGARFEVRALRADEVARAILDEAERVGADAICLATHSRSGLSQLILGSPAQDVLHHAGRPVLLVPAPAEH
jgi:nucleotide-binding universal stress UspA family protein